MSALSNKKLIFFTLALIMLASLCYLEFELNLPYKYQSISSNDISVDYLIPIFLTILIVIFLYLLLYKKHKMYLLAVSVLFYIYGCAFRTVSVNYDFGVSERIIGFGTFNEYPVDWNGKSHCLVVDYQRLKIIENGTGREVVLYRGVWPSIYSLKSIEKAFSRTVPYC